MKLSLNALLVAAGMMLASTTASAQNLTATVQFPFRTSNAEMPRGDYEIKVDNYGPAGGLLTVVNHDANKRALVVPRSRQYTRDGVASTPRLIFHCTAGASCALAEVWGPSGNGFALATPKMSPAERERITTVVVPIRVARAD